MFLFAGHDPGAKNHVRPIFNKAIQLGESAEFLDLVARTELMVDRSAIELVNDARPTLLVGGVSINSGETALFKACNSLDIPTVAVVDLSAKGTFFENGNGRLIDRILVTNQGCTAELVSFGVAAEKISMVGSAHLEQLAQTRSKGETAGVRRFYGIDSGTVMLPFFCGPDTTAAVDAVTSLGNLLPTTRLESQMVIVRPHPRAKEKHLLEIACRDYEFVRYDLGDVIATPDLLSAAKMSLSMASTVSLESIVVGVPSAFFQIGWDFSYLESLYQNVVAVPRIRSKGDLQEFVDGVFELESTKIALPSGDSLESYAGALERTWREIGELIAGG